GEPGAIGEYHRRADGPGRARHRGALRPALDASLRGPPALHGLSHSVPTRPASAWLRLAVPRRRVLPRATLSAQWWQITHSSGAFFGVCSPPAGMATDAYGMSFMF